MGENRTAPGPVRADQVVEEPVGFDQPRTDRIPAAGDLPQDPGVADRQGEESVEPVTSAETVETPAVEPAAGFFDEGSVSRFRDRWRELQADFVDDPARAVRSADELVDEAIHELAERKRGLAGRWQDGQNDTEKLRVAMREYRSFFDQLLNA